MNQSKVIPFNYKQRLIDKAAQYLDEYELSSNCPDHAISVLTKAVRITDRQFKHRIISLFGSLNKPELVWSLFKIMSDENESEHSGKELRRPVSGKMYSAFVFPAGN